MDQRRDWIECSFLLSIYFLSIGLDILFAYYLTICRNKKIIEADGNLGVDCE